MGRQVISVVLEFPQSIPSLFAYLAKHENQAELFSVKVQRLENGVLHPDGVGSVRRIHAPPLLPFEETITQFVMNERIEYRMRNSWQNPIRDHLGTLVFKPAGAGTRLEYTIELTPRIPLTGRMIRLMTERNLRRGLEKLAVGRRAPI